MDTETTDPRLPEQVDLDPQADLTADTETTPASETAADTQASSDVWEQRYRALQAAYTKARMELADLRKRQLSATPPEASPSEPPEDSEAQRYRELWEQSEWARVEAIYGPEVVSAYDAFYRVYETDPTPSGIVAALEAYHAARMQKATQPAPSPQPQPAAQPVVDRNTSDQVPDLAKAIEEAKARRDLVSWIRARRQQVGL